MSRTATRRPRKANPLARTSLILAGFLALAAASVEAKPALKDVAYVREGIITAGMALKIEDECSDISVRMWRGLAFLRDLEAHARSLGYSQAEIDAYLDNKAEETRLRAIAMDRLYDLGAVDGDAASWCAVGRSQIDAATQLGQLLR